jgi:hypothetical protein
MRDLPFEFTRNKNAVLWQVLRLWCSPSGLHVQAGKPAPQWAARGTRGVDVI